MISVKGGTQTYSQAVQQPNFKSDKSQTLSAAEQQKFYGDRNIGEVLNQVADPNWVDPSKMRQVGGDSMGKDGFLKLFLAQLKNQDPTNPMQGHELAAQLAQFTSLEKLNNIDEGIQGMAKASQKGAGDYQVLNLIGKSVSGDSSKIVRTDNKEEHDVRFKLPTDAARVKMSVIDADNKIIRTIEHHNVKSGTNSLKWNGLNEDGQPARLGAYSVTLEAFGGSNEKIAAFTKFDGKITGVNFTPEGTVLMVGDQTVRMQDIKKIYDGEARVAQVSGQVLADDKALSKLGVQPIKAEKGKANMGGDLQNIGDVGLSREMSEKIKKETGSNQGIL